jgi:hypothetical protein
MTPEEFINALAAGGSTNLTDHEDDVEYCPVHSYYQSYVDDLYHEDKCPDYAAKLARLIP